MDKRVCLLFPKFNEGFIMRKVPLGLAYIAASLKEAGIYVEAYNLNVDDFDEIDFRRFDFVGLTCLTPFVDEIKVLCNRIKSKNNNIKIVIGGAHPTYKTVEVFDELPLIDFAVKGEGELSFVKLVSAEEESPSIPGIFYRGADGKISGTPHELIDISSLPYPEQRIFDHGRLEQRNPFRAIMASRGCPFKCFNCQPILSIVQPTRLRSYEDVFEEIKYLQHNYGQDYFGFVDSEFPLKKSWLVKLFELIQKNNLRFNFHCNARSDLLDLDILEIFRELNISRLAIGVESGVQRVIDNVLHKDIDLDHTYEVFEMAKRTGVKTHAHFMIGVPGETLEDMEQTLHYARKVAADSIEFNMLTPWPGTAFYDLCIEKGFLVETNTAKFNEKRKCYVSTDKFTNSEVENFYVKIRNILTSEGWANSEDGSVYFRKQ